jgi:hypothetical protein
MTLTLSFIDCECRGGTVSFSTDDAVRSIALLLRIRESWLQISPRSPSILDAFLWFLSVSSAKWSRYSNWGTGWTAEEPGFDSRQGEEIFLFSVTSRSALGPAQARIQWVSGAVSPGVKPQGDEVDH